MTVTGGRKACQKAYLILLRLGSASEIHTVLAARQPVQLSLKFSEICARNDPYTL